MTPRVCVSSMLLLLALGCGGGGTETAPSANDTSTSDTEGGESSLAQSTAVGEVAPTHGATLFGVYVVVAEPGAPALEEAAAPLRVRDRSSSRSVSSAARRARWMRSGSRPIDTRCP